MEVRMEPTNGFFEIVQQGDTIILTPQTDMGELNADRINSGMKHVLALLNDSSVKNIVLDFHKSGYYGSTALGFFVRLWRTISVRKGRMGFCNLSENGKDVLKVMKLDTLWDISTSREDALQKVRK
jgi:anti-anti-sigma factor